MQYKYVSMIKYQVFAPTC